MTITKIYILDTPHLNDQEMISWLKEENISLPNEDDMGFFFPARHLGRLVGKHLLSCGWKFHVVEEISSLAL
jgi:hypothetical protein